MKVIITERQFKNLINHEYFSFLLENENVEELPLPSEETPKGCDSKNLGKFFGTDNHEKIKEKFSALNILSNENDDIDLMLNKFKCYLYLVSVGMGEKTQGRESGKLLKKMYTEIEKLSPEFKDEIKTFLFKISKIISGKYKSARHIIGKILNIIIKLASEDEEKIKKIIQMSNEIMDHERFEDNEENKIKLVNFIKTYDDDIDISENFLEEFYKKIKSISMEYEESFTLYPNTEKSEHLFKLDRTSPNIIVYLNNNYKSEKYGIKITQRDFSLKSDINKVLYIIESISKCTNCKNVDPNIVINDVVSKLELEILTVDGENQKRDLVALKDIEALETTSGVRKISTIVRKNDGVEVKHKNYKEKSFLSEFFKVDATTKNKEKILNALSFIGEDINSYFNTFIQSMVNNLRSVVSDSIIDDMTENLAGIIFKDDIFVPKDGLHFYWDVVGYGGKTRLAISYELKPEHKTYKFTRDENIKVNQYFNKLKLGTNTYDTINLIRVE